MSNRGDIADLPLLRMLLAIGKKLCELGSDILFSMSKIGSFKRTLLQQWWACLNFNLGAEDLFCWYKQKSDFCMLWQQHKQLKITEMSKTWSDINDDRWYIHYFQPESTGKIQLTVKQTGIFWGHHYLKWSLAFLQPIFKENFKSYWKS